ncbi:IclR family transcriptional regulator [Streptomyces sp. NPDC050535]|uniref:IclR family transcriptional regulator n=1 Tax=Streptomyces sp. NPDC050535 TaxID=3365626 RepID=UPI003796C444
MSRSLSVRQLVRPSQPAAVPSPDAGGRGVLEGAFGLLAAVERAGEAGLTRLASECGLPKSTAHRLLEQLIRLHAVERVGSGYRMGSRMFRLGQGWQPYPGLRSVARGPARRLACATGALVGVNVLRDGQTLVLDWTARETNELLDPLHNGVTWPWFTAAGKVLVAGSPSPPLLGPLPAAWRREAAAIREQGVALDRGELMAGVCCVAVPLLGPSGVPVASLSAVTDSVHRLDRLTHAVQVTGRTISAALNGRRVEPRSDG